MIHKKRRKRRRKASVAQGVETSSKHIASELAHFYNERIHITRNIDEYASARSEKFANLSQEQRYYIIHTGLGVQPLFTLAKFVKRWEA